MLKKIKQLFHRIVVWQQTPRKHKPNDDTETVCLNCGETFASNYCPYCGQSRITTRITPGNGLKIFLDTWGLGTNSYTRTVCDLLTRPGYMISDFLKGRRRPYFPPFKTLLVTGSILAITFAICGGFNEEAERDYQKSKQVFKSDITSNEEKEAKKDASLKETDPETKEIKKKINDAFDKFDLYFNNYDDWARRNIILNQMIVHIVFAFFSFYIFRKSPRYPNMNLAENIITQVYFCCQLGVLTTFYVIYEGLTKSYPTADLSDTLTFLVLAYDYKQLHGFGVIRTLWKTALLYLFTLSTLVILMILTVVFVGVFAAILG